MRDAVVTLLMDYLESSESREFQAGALAVAMVSKINRYVAKHCNRNWNHFVISEDVIGMMVADLLVDSYRVNVDAAFLAVEHMGGHRRDHLRQAIDFACVPRRTC